MSEAPQGALRAVFAGIGRIMGVADKIRNKPAEAGAPANGTASEVATPEDSAATATATAEKTAEKAAPETPEPEAAAPEAAEPQAPAGETESTTPKTATAPLENYDDLTIASVRARLRNLSLDQLNQLIAYEKEHAAREDFIAMFERRIAKVESGK
ncbi:MAG: hypothetical protein J2P25_19980 [Nocardiopsaceae bacterium]|nr:hypothetical protein [Nocardiopsaceae bacterium]